MKIYECLKQFDLDLWALNNEYCKLNICYSQWHELSATLQEGQRVVSAESLFAPVVFQYFQQNREKEENKMKKKLKEKEKKGLIVLSRKSLFRFC